MKRPLLIFLLTYCAISVFAQPILHPDTILQRLWAQTRLFPQENTYLHTDKSDYVAGDTVWFRAYTVNAISRKQENMSRYVYVELIGSQTGTMITRVKVKKDNHDKIYGYLPLPPSLYKGIYHLRAYTRYGLNWGEEGCFSKALRIYTNYKGQEEQSSQPKNIFQVQFMPEGGQAIGGQQCRIAFRAQNKEGRGENIRGIVTSEQKDTLLHFESLHKGMGSFQVALDPKKKYYAVCTNDSGEINRFVLPQAVRNAASLSVRSDSVLCYVTVVHDENFATDSLQLAVLQRGHPSFVGWWNQEADRMCFHTREFDEGVVHFLLLSSTGSILSERLLFINRPEACKVTISSNRDRHEPRQLVEVTLGLEMNDSLPVNGDCSVAVTDANDVPADETVHIRSALLLTADLSGNIETPGWYFEGAEPEREKEALDLLMLTHGWRRYDLQAVLKGNYTQPSLLPEVSMSITGQVKSPFGKPLPNSTVKIHAYGTSLMENLQTDKEGRFTFNGFEFSDSITYLITAQSVKGKENVVLQIEPERFPQPVPRPDVIFHYSRTDKKKVAINEAGYIWKTIQQLSDSDGMRHYLLGEVKVTAPYVNKFETEFERSADVTIKEKRISQSGAPNLGILIKSLTGLNAYPTQASKKDEKRGVAFVLDGIPVEDAETVRWLLESFEVSNIQQIDVLRHSKTIGFFDGRKGDFIAITTKRGGAEYNAHYTATNMATLMTLGYQQPIERYTPSYDSPSAQTTRPDLRTTIYWKPNVTIEDGKAIFSFYTADLPSGYRVVVEGISSGGKVFRKSTRIF